MNFYCAVTGLISPEKLDLPRGIDAHLSPNGNCIQQIPLVLVEWKGADFWLSNGTSPKFPTRYNYFVPSEQCTLFK